MDEGGKRGEVRHIVFMAARRIQDPNEQFEITKETRIYDLIKDHSIMISKQHKKNVFGHSAYISSLTNSC